MSSIDLMSQCFYNLNTFKRHRALSCIKKADNKNDEAIYHELKMYQYFDNLELGLRALQKSVYETNENKGDIENVDIQDESKREIVGCTT